MPARDLEQELHRLLERLGGRRSVPHAVVAVSSGDGSIGWTGAVGDADWDVPMTVDTPYFLASIDKLWTAAVVIQLAGDGHLALDQPIVELLDAELLKGLHRFNDIDHTKKITVRHLMSHTSGLPDWLEDRGKDDKSYVERLLVADHGWTLDEAIEHARDRLTPHFAPQTLDRGRGRIRYSDTNFVLLMRIIEVVIGSPIADVLTDRIIEPLGLTGTHVHGRPSPAGVPTPAKIWAGGLPLDIPLAMASFPAIYSTAADQVTVMRAFTDGTLLSDDQVDAMQARWRRFALPKDTAAARAPSWPIEYGLGLMRFASPRLVPPFRSTPAVIGHTGSTGTWVFACADLDVYLAGTVDQVTAGAVPFRFVPRLLASVSAHRDAR